MKLTLENLEAKLPEPTTRERVTALATVAGILTLGVGVVQIINHAGSYDRNQIESVNNKTVEYGGNK